MGSGAGTGLEMGQRLSRTGCLWTPHGPRHPLTPQPLKHHPLAQRPETHLSQKFLHWAAGSLWQTVETRVGRRARTLIAHGIHFARPRLWVTRALQRRRDGLVMGCPWHQLQGCRTSQVVRGWWGCWVCWAWWVDDCSRHHHRHHHHPSGQLQPEKILDGDLARGAPCCQLHHPLHYCCLLLHYPWQTVAHPPPSHPAAAAGGVGRVTPGPGTGAIVRTRGSIGPQAG